MEDREDQESRHWERQALIAATLSFLWPGAGQAYRRRIRLGALQALPVLVAAAAVVAALLLLGPIVVVAHLFIPTVALGLIVVVVGLGLLRAWSIIDARAPLPGTRHRRLNAWAAVLIVVTIAAHGWVGWSLYSLYYAGQVISAPIAGDDRQPVGSSAIPPTDGPSTTPAATLAPGTSPSPGPEPSVMPGVAERITVLLVGVDNTHERDRALTDTLMVASFDPTTDALTMISIPRDTARLPYYAGGVWEPRINTLMQSASRNPDRFPDGPMGTLVDEIQFIVGVRIDYYAQIDIAGFAQLVDAVGGVDVTLERPLNDWGYQFSPTEIGFRLEPGTHHLNGKYATAFARSRRGSSDYDRAARQQKILLALRAKLDDPGVLLNLPNVVGAAAQMVRTDAPLHRWPEIVAIMQESQAAATRRIVLGPPHYAHSIRNDAGERTFRLELDMDAVAALSVELFGTSSRYWDNSPLLP